MLFYTEALLLLKELPIVFLKFNIPVTLHHYLVRGVNRIPRVVRCTSFFLFIFIIFTSNKKNSIIQRNERI